MSPLYAPPLPERDEWQNPPERVHQGVVCKKPEVVEGVVDKFHPEGVTKLVVTYQLSEESAGICEYKADGEDKKGPFQVRKRYNFNMFKNANGSKMSSLCKDAEALRGKRFATPLEASRFDAETLEGMNGLLNIVHNPDSSDPDKIWANVDTIMPLPKGMAKIEAKNGAAPDSEIPF